MLLNTPCSNFQRLSSPRFRDKQYAKCPVIKLLSFGRQIATSLAFLLTISRYESNCKSSQGKKYWSYRHECVRMVNLSSKKMSPQSREVLLDFKVYAIEVYQFQCPFAKFKVHPACPWALGFFFPQKRPTRTGHDKTCHVQRNVMCGHQSIQDLSDVTSCAPTAAARRVKRKIVCAHRST